jgi:hypothetical protein
MSSGHTAPRVVILEMILAQGRLVSGCKGSTGPWVVAVEGEALLWMET